VQSSDAPTVPSRSLAGWIWPRPTSFRRPPIGWVQTFYILLQLMYLSFYVGALGNLPEIETALGAARTRLRPLPC